MPNIYNMYCDESCHLENDKIPVMVLGCVWLLRDKVGELSRNIQQIKSKHHIPSHFEIKWTKVSEAKVDFYTEVVDCFFNDDDLHFRGILIPDKSVLDHQALDQTHDSWYYKMLFVMLEPVIDPVHGYRVYLDIKDTRSEQKRKLLENVLRTSRYNSVGQIIERVQQIRSHESAVLQLADLLIGATGYHNRNQTGDLKGQLGNSGKLKVIRHIQKRSGKSLTHTTWLREPKFNLLVWQPNRKGLSR